MAKQSAGILLYRRTDAAIEFFLVHPGGPFFRNKDAGWWTVPKGEVLAEEDPFDAALREFEEETGYLPTGDFIALSEIVQKGGKRVFCWAVQGELDPEKIVSNTFDLEWPPRSGQKKQFPEIDRAGWFSYAEAKVKINEKQVALLDEFNKIEK